MQRPGRNPVGRGGTALLWLVIPTLFATIRATDCAAGRDQTGADAEAEAELDETALRHALSGNLCRCTGYVKPLAAAGDVLAAWREASS